MWAHPARAPLLLALVVCAVWANTVHSGFVAIDTPWLVLNNPLLRGGELGAIPTILWDMDRGTRLTLGAEYLPVRDLSVLLDFAIFGDNLVGHHAQNLAWYALSCALVLILLTDLLGARLRTFFAALVFALHPVHVESVAWLASRKDVLSLALVLSSLILFRMRERWRGALWAAVVAFALAYWAKNTAIVVPGLLLVIGVLHERERPWSPALWRDLLPFAGVAVGGLAITLSLGDLVGMYAEPRASTAVGVALIEGQVVLRYLGLLLWPGQLAVQYLEPSATSLSDMAAQSGLIALVAPALIGAIVVRSHPRVTLGIAWFYIALLPVSQIVPIQNLAADRYLLLPSAGVVIALAAALPDRSERWQGLALAGALLWTSTLGLLTWRQSAVWHDTVSLWRHTVTYEPGVVEGWQSLAGALVAVDRHREAESVLAAGLTQHPGAPLLLQGQGSTRLSRGDLDGAEQALTAALRAKPDLRKANNNLAIIYQQTDRIPRAIALMQHTTTRHPLYAEGWNTLGVSHMRGGDPVAAGSAFDEALALAPFDAGTTFNRGSAAWLQDDKPTAVRWWNRTLELEPGHALATRALALASTPSP
jgi:protein O-mannosyl-transferase